MLTKLLITIMAVFCLLFVWTRMVEPSLLSVTRTTFRSAHLPSAADGLRIVQFSDTHFGYDYDLRRFRLAVGKMNGLEPDIAVFTGDLCENLVTFPADTDGIVRVLSSIEAKYGKYAVLGNHDYAENRQREITSVLEAGGFRVLFSESVELSSLGITLTGVEDYYFGDGRNFDFGRLAEDRFNLVLYHEPFDFGRVGSAPVDLMLTGHTHGGQVRIPFVRQMLLSVRNMPDEMGVYSAGNARGSQLFVSRGLGTTQLPFRFACLPEIALITLESAG